MSRFKTTLKGTTKPKGMNKTELAYAERLEWLQKAGEVLWFKFEGIRLRLGEESYYKPDFVIMAADGALEVHEVKGFWREAARVRIKVAADLYPFRFIAVKVIAKKDGGGWEVEEF